MITLLFGTHPTLWLVLLALFAMGCAIYLLSQTREPEAGRRQDLDAALATKLAPIRRSGMTQADPVLRVVRRKGDR